MLAEGKQDQDFHSDEIKIYARALIRVWMYPFHNILEPLVETLSRKKAVGLNEQYITSYYNDHVSPNQADFKKVEALCEKRTTYCSRVLLDTRIVCDLRYQPTEFWDQLEEGKEAEAEIMHRNFRDS